MSVCDCIFELLNYLGRISGLRVLIPHYMANIVSYHDSIFDRADAIKLILKELVPLDICSRAKPNKCGFRR